MSVGENPLSWALWCVSLALLFLWAVPPEGSAALRIVWNRFSSVIMLDVFPDAFQLLV